MELPLFNSPLDIALGLLYFITGATIGLTAGLVFWKIAMHFEYKDWSRRYPRWAPWSYK